MFDLLHVPAVVVARMPRLWWEAMGGNPFGPRESERMVAEKVGAFQESLFAVQVEWVKAALAIGGAMTRLEPVYAVSVDAAGRIVRAGFAPAERRVRRNVRRLTAG